MIFLLISVILLFLLLYFGNYKLSSPVSLTLYCLLIVNLILKILTYNFNESTDYMTYLSSFNKLSNLDFTGMISSDIFEWLFRTLSWFMIFIFPNSLFLVFVLIINLVLAVAIYRFHSNKILSFLSILIYTYLPLFFDTKTNVGFKFNCFYTNNKQQKKMGKHYISSNSFIQYSNCNLHIYTKQNKIEILCFSVYN